MRARGRSVGKVKRQPPVKSCSAGLGYIAPYSAIFWLVVVILAVMLNGCNTTRNNAPVAPAVDIVKVGVAVKRSCVPESLGPEPAYVDTDEALKAAPGPGEAIQILGAGRKQRIARSGEIEPIIASCR